MLWAVRPRTCRLCFIVIFTCKPTPAHWPFTNEVTSTIWQLELGLFGSPLQRVVEEGGTPYEADVTEEMNIPVGQVRGV